MPQNAANAKVIVNLGKATPSLRRQRHASQLSFAIQTYRSCVQQHVLLLSEALNLVNLQCGFNGLTGSSLCILSSAFSQVHPLLAAAVIYWEGTLPTTWQLPQGD